MKFLIIVMLAAGITSCEKIKGWFDQEIDTSYDGTLTIISDASELKSTNDYGFDTTITVRIMNDDLYEHEDKIQGFMTSDCTFEVLSIDSAGYEVTGVMILSGSEFIIYNDDNPGLSVSFPTDWSVNVGSYISLSEEALDIIDDILDDRKDFYISAIGACNKGNISIELRYGIETTVIASPFD